MFIIARIEPAPENRPRAFSLDYWNRTAVRISRAFISPMTAH
jgi:hypothetical protein